MKNWTAPAIEELNINETEHSVLGINNDGGHTGDGENGSLTFGPPTSDPS